MTTSDAVFRALDPFVRDRSLSPQQASRVHDQLCRELDSSPHAPPVADVDPAVEADRGDRAATGGLFAAVGMLMTSSLVAIVGRSTYSGDQEFVWSAFWLCGLTAAVLAAIGVALKVKAGRGLPVVVAGVSCAAAVVVLGAGIVFSGSESAMLYFSGVLCVVLGAVGYRWIGRPVLTLVVLYGAVQIFAQAMADTHKDISGLGSGSILLIGVLGMLLGLATVPAGWRLAAHRMLTIAGFVVAMVSLAGVVLSLGILAVFLEGWGDIGESMGPTRISGPTAPWAAPWESWW